MPGMNCVLTEEHKHAEKEKDDCEKSKVKGPVEERDAGNKDGKEANKHAQKEDLGKAGEDHSLANNTEKEAFSHALSPDANNLQVIGSLWCIFLDRADVVPNRIGDAMFGIIFGRPEHERAHPQELHDIAAVPVNSTAEIPDGTDTGGLA